MTVSSPLLGRARRRRRRERAFFGGTTQRVELVSTKRESLFRFKLANFPHLEAPSLVFRRRGQLILLNPGAGDVAEEPPAVSDRTGSCVVCGAMYVTVCRYSRL